MVKYKTADETIGIDTKEIIARPTEGDWTDTPFGWTAALYYNDGKIVHGYGETEKLAVIDAYRRSEDLGNALVSYLR